MTILQRLYNAVSSGFPFVKLGICKRAVRDLHCPPCQNLCMPEQDPQVALYKQSTVFSNELIRCTSSSTLWNKWHCSLSWCLHEDRVWAHASKAWRSINKNSEAVNNDSKWGKLLSEAGWQCHFHVISRSLSEHFTRNAIEVNIISVQGKHMNSKSVPKSCTERFSLRHMKVMRSC